MTIPLTIGMATFDDFEGTYFSVMGLISAHPEVLHNLQLIVVDNNPDSEHGKKISNLVNQIPTGKYGQFASRKYVPFPEPKGTTQARNEVFRQSDGEYTLCMDSHVLIPRLHLPPTVSLEDVVQTPDSEIRYNFYHPATTTTTTEKPLPQTAGHPSPLHRLLTFFDQWHTRSRPNHSDETTQDSTYPYEHCPHLLSGPLLYDNGISMATHFEDRWRGQMWGTWGTDERGVHPDSPPFEIPAQGLGLFVAHTQSWLKFHEDFRGFGGEEFYIHIKYRNAGRRCVCLPFLRWHHRFGRIGGTPYPNEKLDRVRNYLLGHMELGLDTERLHNHFVRGRIITQVQWDKLVTALNDGTAAVHSDPSPVSDPGCNTCGGGSAKSLPVATATQQQATIDQMFRASVGDIKSGLGSHLNHFVKLMQKHGPTLHLISESTPLIFSSMYASTKETDVCLSLNTEDADMHKAYTLYLNDHLTTDKDSEKTYPLVIVDLQPDTPATTTLADHIHNAATRSTHHLLVPRTSPHHNRKVMSAVQTFLKTNPVWIVVESNVEGAGYTLLSCDPADRKSLPSTGTMAKNLAKAMKDFTLSGFAKANPEEYQRRLEICSMCPNRSGDKGDRCSLCGCYLMSKASQRDAECPAGYWDKSLSPEALPVYEAALQPSHLKDHIPYLLKQARQANTIVEVRPGDGQSTRAFLAGLSDPTARGSDRPQLISLMCGPDPEPGSEEAGHATDLLNLASTLNVSCNRFPWRAEFRDCDLYFLNSLFLSGKHPDESPASDEPAAILESDLSSAQNVRDRILIHGTTTPDGPSMDIMPALLEFLSEHPEWWLRAHYTFCGGLLVLERDDERTEPDYQRIMNSLGVTSTGKTGPDYRKPLEDLWPIPVKPL